MSDRVAVMKRGKVEQLGKADPERLDRESQRHRLPAAELFAGLLLARSPITVPGASTTAPGRNSSRIEIPQNVRQQPGSRPDADGSSGVTPFRHIQMGAPRLKHNEPLTPLGARARAGLPLLGGFRSFVFR